MNQPEPGRRAPVVAIDGPSGSGKSSVAKGVARAMGLAYLDTGAMYRAMTWHMLQQGIDVADPGAVAAEAVRPTLRSGTDPDGASIAVDGHDVSEAIRGPAVTAAVSAVSSVPAVRSRLVDVQREEVRRAVAAGTGIVLEGRDIGTVVLPDADLKVYLTADPRVRAQRRAAQDADLAHGSAGVAATQQELQRRDQQDASRTASPLTRADDAVDVDATDLTLAATIDAVVALVEERVEQ